MGWAWYILGFASDLQIRRRNFSEVRQSVLYLSGLRAALSRLVRKETVRYSVTNLSNLHTALEKSDPEPTPKERLLKVRQKAYTQIGRKQAKSRIKVHPRTPKCTLERKTVEVLRAPRGYTRC